MYSYIYQFYFEHMPKNFAEIKWIYHFEIRENNLVRSELCENSFGKLYSHIKYEWFFHFVQRKLKA